MPKIRPNQTKIKLKLDNKKVQLADKKLKKVKQEEKQESLVVKIPKPAIIPPKQVSESIQEIKAEFHVPRENNKEFELLKSINDFNQGNYIIFFTNFLLLFYFFFKYLVICFCKVYKKTKNKKLNSRNSESTGSNKGKLDQKKAEGRSAFPNDVWNPDSAACGDARGSALRDKQRPNVPRNGDSRGICVDQLEE